MKEAYNFADFTNSFHPAIRFTYRKRKLATVTKINEAVKSKVEGNMHMVSLTDS